MATHKAVVFDIDDTLLSINLNAITDMHELYEREVLPKKNDRLISARPREGAHEAVEAVLDRGLRIALLTNPSFSRACIECRMGWGRAVLDRGLRIALLTNPSFSRACIECRMGWGRMLDMPFELVTTWENSTRVKPSAGYYLEALGKLGLSPEETLMVGNDPRMLDMPFELVTTWENSTRVKPSAGYYLEALGKLGLSPEETLMVGNDPKRDFPSPDIGLKTAYVGNGTQPDALGNGSMADFATSLDLIEARFCGE